MSIVFTTSTKYLGTQVGTWGGMDATRLLDRFAKASSLSGSAALDNGCASTWDSLVRRLPAGAAHMLSRPHAMPRSESDQR